jgi:hypothetical protein
MSCEETPQDFILNFRSQTLVNRHIRWTLETEVRKRNKVMGSVSRVANVPFQNPSARVDVLNLPAGS